MAGPGPVADTTSRQLRLGITAFWALGEQLWREQMAENLRLCERYLKSAVWYRKENAQPPQSPPTLEVTRILPPDDPEHANQIEHVDSGEYESPFTGWWMYVAADDQFVRFVDGQWKYGAPGGPLVPTMSITVSLPRSPVSDGVAFIYIAATSFTLKKSMSNDTFIMCQAPILGNVTFDLYKNDAVVGAINFPVAGAATMTIDDDVSFAPGDRLWAKTPVSLKGLRDIFITFTGAIT